MELVEGPTLGGRLAKRPIALKEALVIARQIAEALEAAENFTPLDEAARARASAEVDSEPHIFPMPAG